MRSRIPRIAALLLASLLSLGCSPLRVAEAKGDGPAAPAAPAEESPASAKLFDTGASSSAPLPGEALARQSGWTRLAEGKAAHRFQGDAVLRNDRLALVLRRSGPGAELYSMGGKGPALRAVLSPAADSEVSLSSFRLAANTGARTAMDATFTSAKREALTVRYELGMGQAFVRTEAREGTAALRVDAPCRFIVLPDFFADDILVDAAELAVDKAELPCENFLLHLVGDGEAIVISVVADREEDAQIELSGEGRTRLIRRSEIPFGREVKPPAIASPVAMFGNVLPVWVAVLEGPRIWHSRPIAKEDADKVLRLDWKAPFPALWRVDWRLDDGLTDTWEMIVQKADGTFAKLDWFGQPDAAGTPDWMRPDGSRWTTVLGSFKYPCWLDKEGQGFLRPLKKGLRCQGPAVLYPLQRLITTPLDRDALVDIVRQTLGVGPCEYILDVEAQRRTVRGVPTCASRSKLDGIYAKKEQKPRRADVEKGLDDVLAFVQLIRGRIEDYAVFGRATLAYLDEQKKAQPALAEFLARMDALTRRIEASIDRRKASIQTPEYAIKLVKEFRKNVLDYEGDDALAKCKKITGALVGIGGSQDELVGECRVAVKLLRQQAGLAMAADPRVASVAREIRRRTQQMLRNPVSYEAPRH